MQDAGKYAAFDCVKAEAFAGEFLSALNRGALFLMTSIGRRTGLFDTMSALPPSTADAIGKKAGLNERYVRASICMMPVSGTSERIDWHTTSGTTGTWRGSEARPGREDWHHGEISHRSAA